MTEKVMVGTRIPVQWQEKIKQLSLSTGKKESELLREAIGRYLGEHEPNSESGTLDDYGLRLSRLEDKFSRFGKIFG